MATGHEITHAAVVVRRGRASPACKQLLVWDIYLRGPRLRTAQEVFSAEERSHVRMYVRPLRPSLREADASHAVRAQQGARYDMDVVRHWFNRFVAFPGPLPQMPCKGQYVCSHFVLDWYVRTGVRAPHAPCLGVYAADMVDGDLGAQAPYVFGSMRPLRVATVAADA